MNHKAHLGKSQCKDHNLYFSGSKLDWINILLYAFQRMQPECRLNFPSIHVKLSLKPTIEVIHN